MGTKRKKIILSVIAIILLVLIIVITFIYIFGKKNHNKDIITIDDGLRGTWNIYQIEKTASDGEIMIIDYKAVFAEVKKNNKINICSFNVYISELNCKELDYIYNRSNNIIEIINNETFFNGKFTISKLGNDVMQFYAVDNNQDVIRINLKKTIGM